jgi:Haem-NO-binding
MHGVIFASFRDFLLTAVGPEPGERILAGRPIHMMSEAYPDHEFLALVGATSRALGADQGQVLRDFGVFAGSQTFPRLYPAFFSATGDTRSFLITVEDRIHEVVRATVPNARPPQLDIAPLGEDGVRITYTSPRRLCVLLAGLVAGTAAHYGDEVEIDETACMRRGDPACVFEVRVRRAERAA